MTRFESYEQERERRKLESKGQGWRLDYPKDPPKTPGVPNLTQVQPTQDTDDIQLRPEKITPIFYNTGKDRVIRSRPMSTIATRAQKEEE